MIRFKKDDGSNYPEWIEKKLGDIGSVAMCRRIFKEQTSDVGDVPFYKIGTFGGEPDAYISRELFEEYKEKYPFPEKGELLLSASGSIGRIVEYDGQDAYFQDSNIVWLNHDNEVINGFLKIFYTNVKWSGLEGSTIKRLYNKNILETKIKLPCLEEQQKIADFLSSVDDIITASEKEVAALEEQKRGAMQKIFSQEVRFKADDGSDYPEWEELKLEDCCNGFDNQRKPVSAAKRESGNVPYYGANGIQDYVKDYIFDGEYVLLAEDGGNFDDFATRPIAQYISGKAWVNNHAHVIQAKENSITKYIFYTLVHKDIRKYINGTSRSKLNQADMWMIQIPVPRLEEQQKIADFLSDFDTAIYLAKQELEQWKELKKGLLQQLFE